MVTAKTFSASPKAFSQSNTFGQEEPDVPLYALRSATICATSRCSSSTYSFSLVMILSGTLAKATPSKLRMLDDESATILYDMVLPSQCGV